MAGNLTSNPILISEAGDIALQYTLRMHANKTTCLVFSLVQCCYTGDLIDVPLSVIRRPLGKTRSNGKHVAPCMPISFGKQVVQQARLYACFFSADQDKVQALMESIQEIGLKEPVSLPIGQQFLNKPMSSLAPSCCALKLAWYLQIDILEVESKFYGFSGCHRFEVIQACTCAAISAVMSSLFFA